MPPRGRKPKPTAIKLHEGNRGKRRLSQDEPSPPAAEVPPEPPAHLDADATTEWHRLAPALTELKVLTELDRGVLAGYCTAWSAYVKADMEVQRYGDVMYSKKIDKTGREALTAYMSPYVNLRSMAMKQMHTYGTELGLSPSSRSRIHLGGNESDDGFEDGIRTARTA